MDIRDTLSGACADAVRAIPEERWLYLEYQESISDQIAAYMEEHSITRADVAKKLGTSRAYITKVLGGNANMTMETLVYLLFAMGAKPITQVVSRQAEQNHSSRREKTALLRLVKKSSENVESWPAQGEVCIFDSNELNHMAA